MFFSLRSHILGGEAHSPVTGDEDFGNNGPAKGLLLGLLAVVRDAGRIKEMLADRTFMKPREIRAPITCEMTFESRLVDIPGCLVSHRVSVDAYSRDGRLLKAAG